MSVGVPSILKGTPFQGHQVEDLRNRYFGDALNEDLLRDYVAVSETFRVYSSVSIEGSTLTMPEVERVLHENAVIPGGHIRQREADEVKRLARALHYVDSIIHMNTEASSPISERNILDLHALILGDAGGVYRDVHVRIAGSRHVFPNHLKVPEK